MARSRIAAMSASFFLVLGATLGNAAAQSPGAPLPLLQIDHAKTAVHARRKAPARVAKTEPARKAAHRHIAKHSAKGVHAKTRNADADRDLPVPTTAALGYAAAPMASPVEGGHSAILAPLPFTAVTTERVVDTDPNAILNGGHTVPAAMLIPAKPAPSAPKAKPVATNSSPPVKAAAAAPATPKPAARAMMVKPTSPSRLGSASWIAQLLAALGGAMAAGAVAWSLIRPTPRRNYG